LADADFFVGLFALLLFADVFAPEVPPELLAEPSVFGWF
jgi:hypothetical protein